MSKHSFQNFSRVLSLFTWVLGASVHAESLTLMSFPEGFSPVIHTLAKLQDPMGWAYDFNASPYQAPTSQTCVNSYGASYYLPMGVGYNGNGLLAVTGTRQNDGEISSSISVGTNGGWTVAPAVALLRTFIVTDAALSPRPSSNQYDLHCKSVVRYQYVVPSGGWLFTSISDRDSEGNAVARGETECTYTLPFQTDIRACSNEAAILESQGGKKCLEAGGKRFLSTDGKALLELEASGGAKIRLTDGSVQRFQPGAVSTKTKRFLGDAYFGAEPRYNIDVTWLRLESAISSSGHVTTYSYTANGEVESLEDALGRRTRYVRQGDDVVAIEAPGVGGALLRYGLEWKTFEFHYDDFFPTAGFGPNSVGQFRTLTALVLPDGKRFEMNYQYPSTGVPARLRGKMGFGNLLSVKTPDGALETFEYGQAFDANMTYSHPTPNDYLGTSCPSKTTLVNAYRMTASVVNNGSTSERHEFVHEKDSVLRFSTQGGQKEQACSVVFWTREIQPDGQVVREAICGGAAPFGGRVIARESYEANASTPFDVVWNGNPSTGTLFAAATALAPSTQTYGDFRTLATLRAVDGILMLTELTYDAPNANVLEAAQLPQNRSLGNVVRARVSRVLEASLSSATQTLMAKFGSELVSVPPTRQSSRQTPSLQTTQLLETHIEYLTDAPYLRKNLRHLSTRTLVFGASASELLSEVRTAYDESPLLALAGPSDVKRNAGALALVNDEGQMLAENLRGYVTSTTVVPVSGEASEALTSRVQYAVDGAAVRFTDVLGNVSEVVGPAPQQCSTQGVSVSAVRNALGHTTQSFSDCYSGVTLKTIEADGNTTCLQYDVTGRVVEKALSGDALSNLPTTGTSPLTTYVREPSCDTTSSSKVGSDGEGPTEWMDYADDLRGVRGRAHTEVAVKNGSATGNRSLTFFDAAGRKLQTCSEVDPNFFAATSLGAEVPVGPRFVCDYVTYGVAGRVERAYSTFFVYSKPTQLLHPFGMGGDAVGCADFVADAYRTPMFELTSFDGRGRVVASTSCGTKLPPLKTEYRVIPERGLFELRTIDREGHVTTVRRDVRGHDVEIDRYSSECSENSPGDGICRTLIAYDAEGKPLSMRLPKGKAGAVVINQYEYDGLGRLRMLQDDNLGVWKYSYSKRGELTLQVDPEGNQVAMTYDVLGRMKTLRAMSADGREDEFETYFYDGEQP